jgi:hypothetical protein
LNQAVNIIHRMQSEKARSHFFYAVECHAFASATIGVGSGDCYFSTGILSGVECLDWLIVVGQSLQG